VELLIVISIIGVLVGLLMPAVQSAQESGRRIQCANNLHQMALGCTALEAKYGYFPSGGWGWQWAGEPDRGYGKTQPGGWHYNILPFIDLTDLHDMGAGLSKPGDSTSSNSARRAAGQALAAVPVSVFICPTRHKPQAFPYVHSAAYVNIPDPTPVIARSDYAANAGSNYNSVPGSPNTGYSNSFDWSTVAGSINATSNSSTGVIGVASQVTLSMIKDGASNTYLIGERYLMPDCYATGSCCDNDQGWNEGFDWDTIRGTGQSYINASFPGLPPAAGSGTPIRPFQDRPGFSTNGGCSYNFGSAHSAGFNMAFCGGEVRQMNYDIDPVIHMQLGHRSDGEPTDATRTFGGN
jgi:hypothetical protein